MGKGEEAHQELLRTFLVSFRILINVLFLSIVTSITVVENSTFGNFINMHLSSLVISLIKEKGYMFISHSNNSSKQGKPDANPI
jgi:hypothetical protein